MLGKNIAIKGIFTTILFITIGISQVSLEIKIVDTNAATLDNYITNAADCSYCADPTYNNNSKDWFDQKDNSPECIKEAEKLLCKKFGLTKRELTEFKEKWL